MSVSPRTVREVCGKELLESVRDRRTLFVALILPVLLYPLMMLVVAPLVSMQKRRLQEEIQPVAVTGEGREALVRAVLAPPPADGDDGDVVAEGPAFELVATTDPAADLRDGVVALWIEAGAGVAEALSGDGSAAVTLHWDSSDDTSRAAYTKWQDLVEAAEARLVDERLARLGLADTLLDPIRIDDVLDAASSEQRAGYLFGKLLAFVLVLMTLSSSFYPAVDAVAGEKERGTMETLLVAPCGRVELVLGKYLAVLVVTLVAALLNLASMWLTMGPLVGGLGIDGLSGLELNPTVIVGLLVLLVPLGALFAALSLSLSTMARSVKEAQHYLTPAFLVVMPLAMVVVIPNVELTLTLAAVPVTNVVLFFRDLMVGKVDVLTGLVVLSTTTAVAGLALWATVHLFLREETLFRGPEGAGGLIQRPRARRFPTGGAAVLLFSVSLAILWYAQPALPTALFEHVVAMQFLLVLLPCALLAWWLRVSPRATFRLGVPDPPAFAYAMLLAVPIGLAAPIANGALQRVLLGTSIDPEGPFQKLAEAFDALLRAEPAWVLVLLLGVLPAVCEELVYRGFHLSAFSRGEEGRRRPGLFAVVAAAALFALFHIYPEKFASTFVVGLLLGLLAVAGRSIWPAVLAHSLNNGSLVLYAKTEGGLAPDSLLRAFHEPENASYPAAIAATAVVLAASVAAVLWLRRRTVPDGRLPAT